MHLFNIFIQRLQLVGSVRAFLHRMLHMSHQRLYLLVCSLKDLHCLLHIIVDLFRRTTDKIDLLLNLLGLVQLLLHRFRSLGRSAADLRHRILCHPGGHVQLLDLSVNVFHTCLHLF